MSCRAKHIYSSEGISEMVINQKRGISGNALVQTADENFRPNNWRQKLNYKKTDASQSIFNLILGSESLDGIRETCTVGSLNATGNKLWWKVFRFIG